MSASGEAGLSKATLRVVSGTPKRTELRFLYNPTEYTVTKGSTWNRPQTTGAKSATKPQFGGTNPQTLQMMTTIMKMSRERSGQIAANLRG